MWRSHKAYYILINNYITYIHDIRAYIYNIVSRPAVVVSTPTKPQPQVITYYPWTENAVGMNQLRSALDEVTSASSTLPHKPLRYTSVTSLRAFSVPCSSFWYQL